MEATALSVGKSALDGALGYAKSVFAEEVALQLGVRRDHDFIRDELAMMQAFLIVAHEEERDDDMVVRTWVNQVRDVAYDAEDSLQDFAVRLGNPSWWRFPRMLLDRRRVAARMKELRAKIEDVSQRNVRYQLIRSSSSSRPVSTAVEQCNMVSTVMSGTEEAMRQRNNRKMDLIKLIHNREDGDLRVIAIWGLDIALGLEDASIVRMAYNHLKRCNKFECQAWISITHPFNPVEFIRSIVKQFFVDSLHEATKKPEKSDPKVLDLRKMRTMKENDALLGAFREYMNEKSFLIVLDGISSNEEWYQIKECFPSTSKKGSRIIVCTEEVEVASLCVGKDTEIPEQRQLATDPALFAFYEKGVFKDPQITKDSQDITDLIVEGPGSNADITHNNGSTGEKRLARMGTIISAFKESQLIGRMEEKIEIIKMVSDNSSQEVKVISIWGMGGLGKTTLVKQVYQSQELGNKFEKRACVTIKRPFNKVELHNSLVKQLVDNDREKGINQLSLTQVLEGKTYLIVLDDLSSTGEWDAISNYFPRAEVGSRILVTTRVQSIANHCSEKEENIHNLKTLGQKDACDLFTEKVFGKITNVDDEFPELADVTKLILKKCSGLPLAIVTIGGFLSKQPKSSIEWRKLNGHIGVELQMNEEFGTIKDILIKSYDCLPYHLKSCFLYMSIFPEDHNISRRRLVHRWVAEGYSSEKRGKSPEDIADKYFMELIDRSMILPYRESVGTINGIDSCHVHDLMREISILKSLEENLVFRLEEGCSSRSMGTTRHLSISSNWKGDESEFESVTDLSHIRSLTVYGRWRPFFISDKMRLLRVLDLEGTWNLCDHQLTKIGKLLHLKYLSLRGCRDIYHLPDSLGNLKQLQTLDIKYTRIVKLPKCIIELRKLKYIYAGDSIVLPSGLRRMKALHSLGIVNIARGKSILQEIKCLTQLRKLAVVGISKKNCQEFCSSLAGLSCLESLSVMPFWWSECLNGCLDCVSSAPTPESLQALKLYGKLDKLPEWFGELQNLVKLKLRATSILEVDNTMQLLGKLPNLAILHLLPYSFNDCVRCRLTFCRDAPFRSLMVLELCCASDSLDLVEFKEEEAPNLELLRFHGAPYLPNSLFSGLASLRSLKEFELPNRWTYKFEEDVQSQLAENPNRPMLKRFWKLLFFEGTGFGSSLFSLQYHTAGPGQAHHWLEKIVVTPFFFFLT